MKIAKIFTRILSALFGVFGIAIAAAAVYVSFYSIHAAPVLVKQPDAAEIQVVRMLDSVCDGDFDAAGNMMQGTPNLGVDRPASDEVGVLIWDAFLESLSYEVAGDCYATDSGVAQDIRFTCLDVQSVTATLRERSQNLLEQRVAEAEDISEVYDENNNYREDVVMDVLYDAAQAALEEDAQTQTVEVTVNLVYDQGQWWIVPDDALLKAISGGILS